MILRLSGARSSSRGVGERGCYKRLPSVIVIDWMRPYREVQFITRVDSSYRSWVFKMTIIQGICAFLFNILFRLVAWIGDFHKR
jgi:hypothetical protein